MVTKEMLRNALIDLGVEKGTILEVHASLSSFGKLEGGAETVINTLKEIVTEEGSIFMPALRLSPELPLSEEDKELGITVKIKVLPPGSDRTAMGIVADTFRKLPDTYTGQDVISTSGWGKHGKEALTGGLDFAIHNGGKALMFGVDIYKLTAMHYVESITPEEINNKFKPTDEINRKYPPDEWFMEAGHPPVKAWYKIQDMAYEKGLIKETAIGDCKVMFFDIWSVISLYENELKRDPFGLWEMDAAMTEKKIYELADTSKVDHLFEGWKETLIYSCLQKVMGKIYVTDLDAPVSAMAFVGCFAFYAGVPDKELIMAKPEGFVIMVPQNREWEVCIEECFPAAKKVLRYAIKKDTKFDRDLLHKFTDSLPEGYELKGIDKDIYDLCLTDPVTRDFVSSFESKEKYLEIGRGMVIIKSGRIVAGASSFTRYNEGIEIEVDTVEEERRKGLATIACAALILRCLEEGLYPSWDAQNMNSVHLAEKLGYEFDHEYTAYEVSAEERTH